MATERFGGIVSSRIDNQTTTDPTTGDDSGDGYAIGSVWINTTSDEAFICCDATVGAAVWKSLTAGGAGAAEPGIIYRTGSAEVILPVLGAGNNLSHANGAWSAWDQHVASSAAEYYLAGAVVVGRLVATQTPADGTQTIQLRLQQEVGVGAALSEAVINKAKGFGVGALITLSGGDGSTTAASQTPFLLSTDYPLRNMAASSRIVIRGRADGTGAAVTGRYYLIVYPADIQDHLEIISLTDLLAVPQEERTFPDQTVISLTSAATAWGDVGSFTEIEASLGADYLIEGIGIQPNAGAGVNADFQIEIATGGAGAETTRAWAGFPAGIGVALPLSAEVAVPFPIPYKAVSGSRVSAKLWCSLASAQVVDVRIFARKIS